MCAIRVSYCLFAFVSFAFGQTAKIQGVVSDDGGKNPANLSVAATAQSGDHRAYTSRTSAKGEYSFANLPAGTYILCVQAPGGIHLGNCQWAAPTQVTVAASQTVTQNLSVTHGRVFTLRIDDPNHIS